MILVQHERDIRMRLERGEHQMTQVRFTRILAGARRRLQDHRARGRLGGPHDRLDLLHIVDVERGHAVAVLGRVVQ
jgi:hypothetical protein